MPLNAPCKLLHHVLAILLSAAATKIMWFVQALQKRDLASDPRGEKQVVALLSIPLETHDIVTVLGLQNYPSVMSLLSPATCRQMAVTIVKSILDAGTLVSSEAKVELLFSFIAPLVKDIPGALDDTDDEVRPVVCHAVVDISSPFSGRDAGPVWYGTLHGAQSA